MNLSYLSLLTISFNNDLLTSLMIKSFYKQIQKFNIPIIIVDNGDKSKINSKLNDVFTIIDNFNHKLIQDFKQCSKNHCAAIDYALKNAINTKWALLVDNDIFFKNSIKNFLEIFDDESFDCAGEIGWDDAPPVRLFPYFCLINVEKFKKESLSYFDKNRIIENPPIGKLTGLRGPNTKCWYHDTGSSFYEDIKNKWKIKEIKLDDYIVHNKTTGMKKMEILNFIQTYKYLWSDE